MSDLFKIKDKIAHLKKLTVENGCTPEEALSAAQKVLEIMQKHNLSESEVIYEEINVRLKTKRRRVADSLCAVISTVTDTIAFSVKTSDGRSAVYFGNVSCVTVASYLHELVVGAYDRAEREFKQTQAYQRQRKGTARNGALKIFARSFVAKMTDRLQNLWWRQSGYSTLSDALEAHKIQSKDLMRIIAQQKDWQIGKAPRPLSGARAGNYDDAKAQGYQAAKNAAINPGVGRGGDVPVIGSAE